MAEKANGRPVRGALSPGLTGNVPVYGAYIGTNVDDEAELGGAEVSHTSKKIKLFRSLRRLYLVTVVKHQKKDLCTEREINEVLLYLQLQDVDIIEGCTEKHGKYNQLHYHGIMEYNQRYNNLTTYQGFRIFWTIITGNLKKVRKYIYKNKKNKNSYIY